MTPRPMYYKLDSHRAVPCDALEWAKEFDRFEKRVVAQTKTVFGQVSTVFLGMDHSFSFNPEATPILFETMVFGGPFDQTQVRYSTWEQAEKGHANTVRLIKGPWRILMQLGHLVSEFIGRLYWKMVTRRQRKLLKKTMKGGDIHDCFTSR